MAKCLAAIKFCRMRVTRLDADGTPTAGPNNVYVTDKPVSLGVTPVIEAGEDKTRVGGCDCIVASYRGFDKLKWFDFDLELAVWEPGLIEMLTGASAILSSSDPIGFQWSEQAFDCSGQIQPNVVLEGWQVLQNQGSPDTEFPYMHWVWPLARFQISDYTLENDFAAPALKGYSQPNSNWGEGIFSDVPEAIQSLGAGFYTATIPDAECGYQSQAIT